MRHSVGVLTLAAHTSLLLGCFGAGEAKEHASAGKKASAGNSAHELHAAADPRHATPADAFEAFKIAAQNKDWPAAMRSCAVSLQDHLVKSNVAIGYRIIGSVPELKADFEKIVRRHVPEIDKIKKELIDAAHREGHSPLASELADRALLCVKDKPAFVSELFGWFESHGIGGGLPADAIAGAELRRLKITGDSATAAAVTIEGTQSDEFPIKFVRETGGWRLLLPEL